MPRSWWTWLCAVGTILVVLGPTARYLDYRLGRAEGVEVREWARLLDLSTEANVPTFYATCLLVLLGLISLARAALAHDRAATAWIVLAVVAIVLALDEAASLHERLLDPLGARLGGGAGPLTFGWVVPGASLAALGVAALVVVLRPLPASSRPKLIVALIVFVTGALGVEAASGAVLDHEGHSRVYLALTTVEEAFELAGVLIALRAVALGLSLRRTSEGLSITCTTRSGSAGTTRPSSGLDSTSRSPRELASTGPQRF